MDSLFHYSLDLIRWLKLAGSFNLNTNYSKDWCQLSFSPRSNDHIWVGSGYTSSSATGLLCFWSCQQKTHGSDMQAREQCESITEKAEGKQRADTCIQLFVLPGILAAFWPSLYKLPFPLLGFAHLRALAELLPNCLMHSHLQCYEVAAREESQKQCIFNLGGVTTQNMPCCVCLKQIRHQKGVPGMLWKMSPFTEMD